MGRLRRRAMSGQGSSGRFPLALFVAIFLLVGTALSGGSAYMFVDTRRDIAAAKTASGTVIDLIAGRDSDGDDMYYPRVRFVTSSGTPVEFTGSVGSSPPGFDVGEEVAVLYDPTDPAGARIDTFFQLWFGTLVLGALGLVFGSIGIIFAIAGVRSARPRTQRSMASVSAEAPAAAVVRTVERTARD